jgi:hypothetical protein
MNDEEDRGTESLIPSLRGELVSTRSTSLVRRGLSHLEREKPPRTLLRVVIGNCENSIGPYLVKILEKGGDYEVVPVVIGDADSLTNYARRETVDLFVLIVNNIFYSIVNNIPYTKPRRILELIASLKAIRQTPIIALSGDYFISTDTDMPERILRAGADVLLYLPVWDEFIDVVRNVLSKGEGKLALPGEPLA